jgi:hypothetical protein
MITSKKCSTTASHTNMLDSSQTKNILYVYNKFLESESKGWDEADDNLLILEWLSDIEIYRESEILYSYQKNRNMGCTFKHPPGAICFSVHVLEAVDSILQLYQESNVLHPKNRYVLEYYIILCQAGQIVELLDP